MNEVLVIGHKNPDTDAICAAIGYAEFKRRTDIPHAIAARCGNTNERIDFVLKMFGFPAPKFVTDVSPKVSDVMSSDVMTVNPKTLASDALNIMDTYNIRVLPVVKDDHTCQGLVSFFKMGKFFFPGHNRLYESRKVIASIDNLAKSLTAETIFATAPEREEELILTVGAMTVETFAKRLDDYPRDRLVVVVGDRWDIQNMAIREGVRLVIVTGNLPIEKATIEAARKNNVSLLLSPHDTATTAILCRSAITVDHLVEDQYLSFAHDELVSKAQRRASDSSFAAFPVFNENKQLVGILSKSDFLKKVDRQLILVDHNELTQAVNGADKVEIIEIIDHHRIGALTTAQPIVFRNEPVGSTSTIVADCFFRFQVELPKNLAGLLMTGLVSDTLNLSSPTATPKDAEILKTLEQISGVRAQEIAEKIFSLGSLLISKQPEDVITSDCKEYTENGHIFSVAQIEEIGFDLFGSHKEKILSALDTYARKKSYLFACLLVTDIVKQTSLLAIVGSESLIEQIDYPKLETGIFELNNVLSRKKQLMPYLSQCLDKMRNAG